MTDIEKLPQHLETIGHKDWERLFSLLDEINEINETKKFGEVKGMEKLGDNTFTMPYWSWSNVVDKFFDVVHDLGLVTVFDWPGWKEGKDILNNPNQDYNQLDTITLCKLITVIIRADRFSDGFLVGSFENGIIPKIIYTLKLKVTNGEK